MCSGITPRPGPRAPEYCQRSQRDDPGRQGGQRGIRSALKQFFQGRRVLEVACGTGFWTCFVAEVAKRVCAIDAAPQMLALARAKNISRERVEFRLGDAYKLDRCPGDFDAGLANFWF